jgi:hypothetical protein
MRLAIEAFELLFLVVFFVFVLIDARYTFRRRASKNWPATTAMIRSGIVGFRGPFAWIPRVLYRVHFTYSYSVNGIEYSGRFFCLTRGKERGETLCQALVGKSVPVKYNDQKPEVALLTEDELAGKRVMQGPSWTYH